MNFFQYSHSKMDEIKIISVFLAYYYEYINIRTETGMNNAPILEI